MLMQDMTTSVSMYHLKASVAQGSAAQSNGAAGQAEAALHITRVIPW